MELKFETETKERLVASLFALTGFTVMALSIWNAPFAVYRFEQFLLSVIFAAMVVVSDIFPIHLGRGTKLAMTNLPVFLGAALLPAPLAVISAGVGFLIAQLRSRSERGTLPRDIALDVGRWMLTVYLGYQVIHMDLPWLPEQTSRLVFLLAGALTFLLVDFTGFSIFNSLILQEPFLYVLRSNIAQGGGLELVQYSVAILGALAGMAEIWSLPLLVVPLIVAYIGFKNMKEVHYETLRILEDMADVVDLRDVYTGGHSRRVAGLVHQILIQMNLSGPEATLIENAARVHDIGKIGIPDAILIKPGKLLPEEMDMMKTHPAKGAELVSKYKDFARGTAMILHHHEWWNGEGYPAGLKAHEIPFGARIIYVADSFDAMTSDRPYRKALSVQEAVEILIDGRGKQWDPAVVDAFIERIYPILSQGAGLDGIAVPVNSDDGSVKISS